MNSSNIFVGLALDYAKCILPYLNNWNSSELKNKIMSGVAGYLRKIFLDNLIYWNQTSLWNKTYEFWFQSQITKYIWLISQNGANEWQLARQSPSPKCKFSLPHPVSMSYLVFHAIFHKAQKGWLKFCQIGPIFRSRQYLRRIERSVTGWLWYKL